jgi:Ferroportin1 (FPN1)
MDALNPSSSPKDDPLLKHSSSSMNRIEDGELEPLLEHGSAPPEELARVTSGTSSSSDSAVLTGVGTRLYISHFLSTWNSRVFEFGAVLFIAEIFPGTLLAVSVYAVVRSASAIVLAPQVGMYIDANDRLKVVRSSIGLSCQPAASPSMCNETDRVGCWQLASGFRWHCPVSAYGRCWCTPTHHCCLKHSCCSS